MVRTELAQPVKRALRFILTEMDLYQPPPLRTEMATEPVAHNSPPTTPSVSVPELDPLPDDWEPGLSVADPGDADLTMSAVQRVLDDMVRPALQADGGDIMLVKIEHNDIYVRLRGACSSCPSSVMTMKMGVERLLQDEFPDMGELIDISSSFAS